MHFGNIAELVPHIAELVTHNSWKRYIKTKRARFDMKTFVLVEALAKTQG